MELRRTYHTASPWGHDRVRIVADVAYDDRRKVVENYWFDLPAELAPWISASGNPWLICLLPLAAKLGQPLRLSQPVDSILLNNCDQILETWSRWYPQLRPVPIEADVQRVPTAAQGRRVGAFFSGGVDSSFTALELVAQSADSAEPALHNLLTVWGFDIPLQNRRAFHRMRTSLRGTAGALGLNLIDIATNLRSGRLAQCDWPTLAHGPALAATGLILEPYFEKLFIAATDTYDKLTPWGSHPDVDPLFSTTGMQVIHHGADFGRVDKLARVAASDVALRTLRVCWELGADYNCGQCAKCYCTMLHLYLLGVLDRTRSFQHVNFRIDKVRKIRARTGEVREYLEAMKQLAWETGRQDVAAAIDESCHIADTRNMRLHHLGVKLKRALMQRLPWLSTYYWRREKS